ncbi:Peptidoglycan/LPS O-acetylase OafA/YrhL, contains acyltransferase and SGNH-hydrolase domains [Pseudoxanthomonas sp. GM95]|uniref:acyltransferase family protein n=1 Tax=Pseudoxanthomonas sp. GM95 TaxID=1881043 RepID=UPI0008C6F73D|nr:acyltransferase [Pseudoxanthomonas sp. GM95]SEL93418.1 Peptidoglycan/LPS O-acetylase OafA/YrhL, contains acyltransferase and SGNH-hydrolase domains [Pseudoxanthomonas sp. GM95]
MNLSSRPRAASAVAPSRSTIGVLQAGRAIAALAVVFSHTLPATQTFVEQVPEPIQAIVSKGYLGVDFFFVLSGFIIFYINRHFIGKQGWLGTYVESRVTRIYLPYLPIAVALGLFYVLAPGMGNAGVPWSWWATLTLVPNGPHSTLGVAWSLSFELCFYALALLFLRSGRPLLCAALWALLIVVRQLTEPAFEMPFDLSPESILLNPINLEFVFGMFAAQLALSGRGHNALLLTAAAICLAGSAALGFERVYSPVFGLALAFALVPMIRAEWRGHLKVGAILMLLGNASYAIYLVHFPLLSVTSRIVGESGPFATYYVSMLVGVGLSIVVGVAYHLLYELPTLRWARNRIARAFCTHHAWVRRTSGRVSSAERQTVSP